MKNDHSDLAESILSILEKNSRILIIIKGSPDPDALASSYFLQKLGEAKNCNCIIFSQKKPSLPQNCKMISTLKIPLVTKIPDISGFDGYAVFDFQTPDYEKVSSSLPCLIHVDHHSRQKSDIIPEFQLIDQSVNAVSTLLVSAFLNTRDILAKAAIPKIATALSYGILSDTDNLTIGSDADRMLYEEIKAYADTTLLDNLTHMPYSEETLTLISKALIGSITYKEWLLAGVGYVPQSMRDSLAITADYLLEHEDCLTVIVFGLIESGNELFIDASFRTKMKNLDLNRLIKGITPDGGGRRHKGAYQFTLTYFKNTNNKEHLWELVKDATIENIKLSRDNLRINEMKSFFGTLQDHLFEIFDKADKNSD